MNKTITIDGIEYALTAVVKEPLICNLNGVDYFLGPESPDELNWEEAVKWCKSLGDGYELPSREILLTVMVQLPCAGWKEGLYWSWSEFGTASAWIQRWVAYCPGGQSNSDKTVAYRVRAIRRTVI